MTLNDSLRRLLESVRAASALQFAKGQNTSLQVSRRCIRVGVRDGYLKVSAGFNARGRPVQLVSLRTRRGQVTAHDWLVTEFAVELMKALRGQSDLALTLLREPQINGGLIPDLAFLITSQSSKKALLFFLEVDCATEPIHRRTPGSDFGSKLRRYRQLRSSNSYRTFTPNQEAKGFRVLVVTPNEARSAEILRAACTEAGGNFVWATEWPTLDRLGFVAETWLRTQGDKRRSIFGTLADKLSKRSPLKNPLNGGVSSRSQ